MTRLAGKGRFYTLALVDHQGRVTDYKYEFPSVTSIIDAVVAKPKLMHWYYAQAITGTSELIKKYGGKLPSDPKSLKQLMAQEGHSPYKKRDDAASRGTDVHKDLETLAAGGSIEATPANIGVINWWRDRGLSPEDVIACEVPLVSFEHRYAGTVDLVYKDPETGKVRLADLKTGKYVHWTHFVQGEAYRRAYEEAGGWVDEVTVIHTPPVPDDLFLAMAQQAATGKPGYEEKVGKDVTFETFKAILEIYSWLPDDWMPEDAE